jgi:hypothetical protein
MPVWAAPYNLTGAKQWLFAPIQHERGSLDPATGDETAILLLQTFASFKTPVPPDMSAPR